MANREIWIMGARLAFAEGVFVKKAIASDPTSTPRFNCGLILPPDHKQIDEIKKIEIAICDEQQWKDKSKGADVYKLLAKKDRLALHDGDDKQKYEGFPSNFYLSPSSDNKPTVMHGRTREPIGKDDGTVYSGCYVNAKVEFWAQDNNWGQRVNCSLLGVQFVRDGDAFGAGAPPANPDDFPDLAVDGDEVDPLA